MTRRYGFLAGLDFAALPAARVADELATLGYVAVSWPLARFDPSTTSAAERGRLVSETRAAGLAISEWVVQIDFVHTDPARPWRAPGPSRRRRARGGRAGPHQPACPDARQPLHRAGALGSRRRRGWGGTSPRARPGTWSVVPSTCWCPWPSETGVDLAVEGVFGHLVHDYYTTLELLRHYDSPRLGINFDPSHGILVGNDIPWVVRQWGSRIRHIHLKDAVGRPGMFGETFVFPLLGEGQVPWAGLFAALDAIGYEGYLSVEFESWDYYRQVLGSDPIAAARLSMGLLERLDPGPG